jgi:hypothetical protein
MYRGNVKRRNGWLSQFLELAQAAAEQLALNRIRGTGRSRCAIRSCMWSIPARYPSQRLGTTMKRRDGRKTFDSLRSRRHSALRNLGEPRMGAVA